MKITICDICKTQTKETVETISIKIGSQMSGAGDIETIFKCFDLCSKHLSQVLSEITNNSNTEINKCIVDKIQKKVNTL